MNTETTKETLNLVCTFCGCAVSVDQDPDSAGCGDIHCYGCTASWDGYSGTLIGAPSFDVLEW